MVKHICKKCRKYIRARKSADVFNELTDKYNHHICWANPANSTADCIKHKTCHSEITLAEFLCKRPNGKDTDTHRNTADNGNHCLCFSVIVCTENIVAEIYKSEVFELRAYCANQEIKQNQHHIFVCNDCLEQIFIRDFFLIFLVDVLHCDTLFCEIIFHNSQRQS